MKVDKLLVGVIILFIALCFTIFMAIKSLGIAVETIHENGGLKTLKDEIWCGKDGCENEDEKEG